MKPLPELAHEQVDASFLRRIAAPLGLNQAGYARALALADCAPGVDHWRAMLSLFLLLLAVALLLSGVAAFFAYNWTGLSRFAKFGLIQGGIVLCIGLSAWRGIDSLWGRSTLFAAAALSGTLLAVYGQTYQTGADPYGLFLGWLLLILPWALIGRQAGLWMLVVVLSNLALILFWLQVVAPPEGFGSELVRALGPGFMLANALTDFRLAQLVFALNVGAMIAWEYLGAHGLPWAQGRWFPRVLASFALAGMTGTTLVLIFGAFDGESGWPGYGPPLWFIVFAGACLWFYQARCRDLFILAVCLTAVIIIVTSLFARSGPGLDFGLFLGLLVIAQTAAAALWLRRTAERWKRLP